MTNTAPATRRTGAALTCWLALFLLFNAGLLNLAMWYFAPTEMEATVLTQTRAVFLGHGGDDSWGPMAAALDQFKQAPASPLYTELVLNGGIKFQYPPSSLFFLQGLLLSGADRVRVSDEFPLANGMAVNDIVGWLFIVINILAVAALAELQLRKHKCLTSHFDGYMLARSVIFAGLALTFYPLVKAFTLGQIQVWINALFAVALLCWAMQRKVAAGATLGIICLIKPHFGLFLVWAALRSEWRFAIACAVVAASGLAASVVVFGWANHLDYLKLLTLISERGETYFANQSVNGVINRLVALGTPDQASNLGFSAAGFPTFNRWVYWGTLLSSLVLLSTAIVARTGRREPVLDFCIMAVSLTLAAPVAWEHHYGITLPVFAALLAGMRWSGRRLIYIIAIYALISNFFPVANLMAASVLNPLQSYTLVGGLLLLVLLYISVGTPDSPKHTAVHRQIP